MSAMAAMETRPGASSALVKGSSPATSGPAVRAFLSLHGPRSSTGRSANGAHTALALQCRSKGGLLSPQLYLQGKGLGFVAKCGTVLGPLGLGQKSRQAFPTAGLPGLAFPSAGLGRKGASLAAKALKQGFPGAASRDDQSTAGTWSLGSTWGRELTEKKGPSKLDSGLGGIPQGQGAFLEGGGYGPTRQLPVATAVAASTSSIAPESLEADVEEDEEMEMARRELERRRKIGEKNKGRVPWNKGRKWSEEDKAKIRERTIAAMRSPKVQAKLHVKKASLRHTDTTRAKIGDTIRNLWWHRREQEALFNAVILDPWKREIWESARSGLPGEAPLKGTEWRQRVDPEVQAAKRREQRGQRKASAKKMSPPKEAADAGDEGDAVLRREQHRRRISESIKALWSDPEYRERVTARMRESSANRVPRTSGSREEPSGEASLQPRSRSPRASTRQASGARKGSSTDGDSERPARARRASGSGGGGGSGGAVRMRVVGGLGSTLPDDAFVQAVMAEEHQQQREQQQQRQEELHKQQQEQHEQLLGAQQPHQGNEVAADPSNCSGPSLSSEVSPSPSPSGTQVLEDYIAASAASAVGGVSGGMAAGQGATEGHGQGGGRVSDRVSLKKVVIVKKQKRAGTPPAADVAAAVGDTSAAASNPIGEPNGHTVAAPELEAPMKPHDAHSEMLAASGDPANVSGILGETLAPGAELANGMVFPGPLGAANGFASLPAELEQQELSYEAEFSSFTSSMNVAAPNVGGSTAGTEVGSLYDLLGVEGEEGISSADEEEPPQALRSLPGADVAEDGTQGAEGPLGLINGIFGGDSAHALAGPLEVGLPHRAGLADARFEQILSNAAALELAFEQEGGEGLSGEEEEELAVGGFEDLERLAEEVRRRQAGPVGRVFDEDDDDVFPSNEQLAFLEREMEEEAAGEAGVGLDWLAEETAEDGMAEHSGVEQSAEPDPHRLATVRSFVALKRQELTTRARMLMAEAERAARALEVQAARDRSTMASLLETRRLLHEARQAVEKAEGGGGGGNGVHSYGALGALSNGASYGGEDHHLEASWMDGWNASLAAQGESGELGSIEEDEEASTADGFACASPKDSDSESFGHPLPAVLADMDPVMGSSSTPGDADGWGATGWAPPKWPNGTSNGSIKGPNGTSNGSIKGPNGTSNGSINGANGFHYAGKEGFFGDEYLGAESAGAVLGDGAKGGVPGSHDGELHKDEHGEGDEDEDASENLVMAPHAPFIFSARHAMVHKEKLDTAELSNSSGIEGGSRSQQANGSDGAPWSLGEGGGALRPEAAARLRFYQSLGRDLGFLEDSEKLGSTSGGTGQLASSFEAAHDAFVKSVKAGERLGLGKDAPGRAPLSPEGSTTACGPDPSEGLGVGGDADSQVVLEEAYERLWHGGGGPQGKGGGSMGTAQLRKIPDAATLEEDLMALFSGEKELSTRAFLEEHKSGDPVPDFLPRPRPSELPTSAEPEGPIAPPPGSVGRGANTAVGSGGAIGDERVLEMCREGSEALLATLDGEVPPLDGALSMQSAGQGRVDHSWAQVEDWVVPGTLGGWPSGASPAIGQTLAGNGYTIPSASAVGVEQAGKDSFGAHATSAPVADATSAPADAALQLGAAGTAKVAGSATRSGKGRGGSAKAKANAAAEGSAGGLAGMVDEWEDAVDLAEESMASARKRGSALRKASALAKKMCSGAATTLGPGAKVASQHSLVVEQGRGQAEPLKTKGAAASRQRKKAAVL